MRQIRFDEKIESLTYISGEKYIGRRFKTISVTTNQPCSNRDSATLEVRCQIEDQARKQNADAYELFSVNTFDSGQEYDTTPYTATATAILYKDR